MQIQVQNSTALAIKTQQLPWKGKVTQTTDAEVHPHPVEPDVYAFQVECTDESPEPGRVYQVLAEIIDGALDVAQYYTIN